MVECSTVDVQCDKHGVPAILGPKALRKLVHYVHISVENIQKLAKMIERMWRNSPDIVSKTSLHYVANISFEVSMLTS